MKKLYAAMTALAVSLAVGVTAMAQGSMANRAASTASCSSCAKAAAPPEQIKKFRIDSLDLRQEMMNKRFELQRENLKDAPDSARIAAIKAEMEAIKAKIDALKNAANIPKSAACCMEDCPLMDGNCDRCMSGKKGHYGDCNKGKACDKAAKNCADCNKTADCGCMNCAQGAACDKCGKAADCGCNKKGKDVKK